MKLAEVANELIAFFTHNDTFELEKNFKDIVCISVNDDLNKALVLKALEALVESKFIEKVEFNGKSWYVLIKPLELLQQQIVISHPTNSLIARIINEVTKNWDKKYVCDPLNIKESDIKFLVDMILSKGGNEETDD